MLIENFRDLASHSSLHGVKFLADSTKWYQRLYWTLALLVCSVIAFELIRKDWSEWKSFPVDVYEDLSPKPLSSVFIPAVTICDSAVLNKDSVIEYLNGNDTLISGVLHFCKVLMGINNLCDFIHSEVSTLKYADSEDYNTTMSEIQKETFFKFYNNFMASSYQFNLENDMNEFGYSTIVNPGKKGICQTVGALNYNYVYKNINLAKFLVGDSNIFVDSGNISIDSDSFNGLPILTINKGNEFISYPSTFSDIKGFKLKFIYDYESTRNGVSSWETLDSECTIAVHSPWEVPSPFIRWQPCDSNTNTLIFYKIYYTYSDLDVEDAPVAYRNCLYPHERSLQYFSYYSQKNCLFECIANKMAAECGCVTPYMPNSDKVKFCDNAESIICVEVLLDTHFLDQFTSDNPCDCLPLCNDIDYTITDLEPVLSFEKQSSRKVIEFRFKDNYISPFHRYLTGTVFQFGRNTMTILDMFLGFSVLSILELVYFLIVIVMRWIEEGRPDYKEKQRQRKQSMVSAASLCTVCKQMPKADSQVFQIGRKFSGGSSSSRIGRDDSSCYVNEFAFPESHELNDNCANCRKLQSFGLNNHVIKLLKNEIRKEIGEQLAGFLDHKSLSEINHLVDEMRADIHELKKRRDIWE